MKNIKGRYFDLSYYNKFANNMLGENMISKNIVNKFHISGFINNTYLNEKVKDISSKGKVKSREKKSTKITNV